MANAIYCETVRVYYRKLGRMRYISHLDMNRCVSRALLRSRLPAWRTMGFNPHVYLTFALPLSLGCESLCESFDFRLVTEVPMGEVAARLNAVLPEELVVYEAKPAEAGPEEIAGADYEIQLDYDAGAAEAAKAMRIFLALPELFVEKRGKAGKRMLDVRAHFSLLALEAEDTALRLTLRCAAGSAFNLNPTLVLDAFAERTDCPPDGVRIVRTAVRKADGTPF